jgi:hypothetical protein
MQILIDRRVMLYNVHVHVSSALFSYKIHIISQSK